MVSAPATRVTGSHEPNAPQVPSVSVAEARSTAPLEGLTPEPASVPSSSVSSTESDVWKESPTSATLWPLGAVVSFARVKVLVVVPPAPLVAVTVCAPVAVVVPSQV